MYHLSPFGKSIDSVHGDEGLRDVTLEELQAEALQRKERMLEKQTPEDAEVIIEGSLVSDAITELVWRLAASKPELWSGSEFRALVQLRERVQDRVDELCGVES